MKNLSPSRGGVIHSSVACMCPLCTQLFEEHRIAVDAYRDAMRNMRGAVDNDFVVIFERVQRFYDIAREAGDRVNAHWKEMHATDYERA